MVILSSINEPTSHKQEEAGCRCSFLVQNDFRTNSLTSIREERGCEWKSASELESSHQEVANIKRRADDNLLKLNMKKTVEMIVEMIVKGNSKYKHMV